MHILSFTPWKLQRGGTWLFLEQLLIHSQTIYKIYLTHSQCTQHAQNMRNMKTWNWIVEIVVLAISSPRGVAPVSVHVAGTAYCVYENYTRICCVCISWISCNCAYYSCIVYLCVYSGYCVYILITPGHPQLCCLLSRTGGKCSYWSPDVKPVCAKEV